MSKSVTQWKNLPVEQFIHNDSADDFDDTVFIRLTALGAY